MLKWSYRSEIWQASRQRCLERLERSKSESRGFETSRSGKTPYRLVNWGPDLASWQLSGLSIVMPHGLFMWLLHMRKHTPVEPTTSPMGILWDGDHYFYLSIPSKLLTFSSHDQLHVRTEHHYGCVVSIHGTNPMIKLTLCNWYILWTYVKNGLFLLQISGTWCVLSAMGAPYVLCPITVCMWGIWKPVVKHVITSGILVSGGILKVYSKLTSSVGPN